MADPVEDFIKEMSDKVSGSGPATTSSASGASQAPDPADPVERFIHEQSQGLQNPTDWTNSEAYMGPLDKGSGPSVPMQGSSKFVYQPEPPQIGGWARPALMGLSSLGKGAADVLDFAQNYGPSSTNLDRLIYGNPLHRTTAGELGKELGVFDNPHLIPHGEENVLAGGAEALGSQLPLAPFTGGLSTLAPAFGGGALSSLLRPGSDSPLLTDILGNVVGALSVHGLQGGIMKAINAAKGDSGPVVAAFDKLGMAPRLAGDVATNNPITQWLSKTFSQLPLVRGSTNTAALQQASDMRTALENTAANMGSSRTVDQLGASVQNAVRAWRDNEFTATKDKLFDPIHAVLKDAPVNGDPVDDAFFEMLGGGSSLENTMSALAPDWLGKMYEGWKEDLPPGGTARWQDVDKVRRIIGAKIDNPNLREGADPAALSRLYAVLTDVQDQAAAKYGQADQWEAAKAAAQKLFAFRKNILGKFVSGDNDVQETITPAAAGAHLINMAKKGGSELADLNTHIPELSPELGSLVLNKAADPAAYANPAQGFIKETSKRNISPEAIQHIFNDPESADQLAQLRTVAPSILKSTDSGIKGHGPTAERIATLLGLADAMGFSQFANMSPLKHWMIAAPAVATWGAGKAAATPAMARFLAAPGSQYPARFNALSGLIGSTSGDQ